MCVPFGASLVLWGQYCLGTGTGWGPYGAHPASGEKLAPMWRYLLFDTMSLLKLCYIPASRLKASNSAKAEQNTRGVLCYPSSTSWLQNGETSRRRCQGLVPSPVDESSGGWIGQAEHGPIWSSPCFCKTLASPDMENTSQVSCLGLFRLPRVFATHYWQCPVSAVKLQQNATFPLKSL